MAKIEIWAKDVKDHKIEFLNDPQHLYLIYTADNGNKEILRGGPDHDHPLPPYTDELLIVKQIYKENLHSDKNPYDWNDGTHIGKIVASGNEQEIAEKWQKMWVKAQKIN
jgi:hypothetical protein